MIHCNVVLFLYSSSTSSCGIIFMGDGFHLESTNIFETEQVVASQDLKNRSINGDSSMDVGYYTFLYCFLVPVPLRFFWQRSCLNANVSV